MLKKFSIKSRLLLLILIPLMGTLILGFVYIHKIYNEYSDATSLKKYISYLPAISNVIHSLQKERGASFGYLKSKNKNKFEEILSAEISNTNEHLLVIQRIRQTIKLNKLSPKVITIITEFPSNINKLTNLRKEIHAGTTDIDTLLIFYSNLIKNYITIIEELNWFNISADTNNSLMSYKYFMLWKENVGQERALGTGGSNIYDLDETSHYKYLLNLSEVKTFKSLFMEKSTPKEQSFIYDVLNSPNSKKILEIEEFIIHNRLHSAQSIISGLQWYNLLSAKINLMNEAERKLIARLLQQTKQVEASKKSQLIASATMTVILFLVAILLSIRIAISISNPIQNIGEVMSSLITGRAMSSAAQNIPHMNEKNEIGRLSRQFSEMLNTIQTQNKNLERERDNAQAANIAKNDFLANMSHELRTPLNSIIGFSEVLSLNKDQTIEENTNYLDYIHSSGEKLLLLVDNILNISSVSAGGLYLAEDIFSLQKRIYSCFTVLNEKAEQAKISLISNMPETDIIIKADRKRLGQVFHHLLSNAIKFSSGNDEVSVAAAVTQSGELSIVIRDNGIGMDDAEQEKAFQIFGQSEKGYSRIYDGIGLGLPLARGIIEKHGGTLTLESTPDIGTMVFIKLPKECLVL